MPNMSFDREKLSLDTLLSSTIKMIRFTVITAFAVIFCVLTIGATFQISHTFHLIHFDVVARERFGLSSEAPEAPMLDHYTTGLQPTPKHASLL